jgi:hypothetical protein
MGQHKNSTLVKKEEKRVKGTRLKPDRRKESGRE